ncbi:MAG: RHS repeat-associated core domain-containing protein, partial [Pseudomonadota bacterium]
IHYRWDGDQTIQEIPIQPDGTPDWHKATHNHHNNAGDIVAQTHNGTLYYLNTDPNGLPRTLLDETGTIHWRARYDLWGKQQAARHEQPQPPEQPKLNCNLRFHGQHYDAESGLHYDRYRYYDPDTAQYLSPDPIGLAGGLRVQGYVHNPNTWIDPLGLSCKCNATKSRGYDRPETETRSGTSVKQKDAVDKWDEFLGPDQTNIDPRDGLPDPDRIWSTDGKRSIRFGEHEMNSKPNKLHYHQETWYDDKVENVLQRIPK